MLLLDEGSITLKEVSGILDEFLSRRHRLRFCGLRVRELLFNLGHFAVEARLIPFRRRAFNARMLLNKAQMGILELLHPNLERGFGERGAGTE